MAQAVTRYISIAKKPGYAGLALPLLGILYLVGIIGHLVPLTLPLLLAMTPWFLLICGLAVTLPSAFPGLRLDRSDRPFLVWLALTYLVTFFLEALGVATGLVFGSYRYGPSLGFGLYGVPLVIAFNWALVVYGALRLSGYSEFVRRRPLVHALATGALATGFDWIMEPLAIRLDYWRWEGGDIPLQNYLAWFCIAFVAALGYCYLVDRRRSGKTEAVMDSRPGQLLAAAYLLIQAVFFAAIRLGWLAGVGG